MATSHLSKVFFDDLEEIELALSFTTSTSSSSIRIYIQTTSSFIFHDQLTFSTTPQRTYIPYSSFVPTKLKFETIATSADQNTSNEVTLALSTLLDSPKQSLSLKIGQESELTVTWMPAERSPLNLYMSVESLGLKFTSSWFKRSDPKPYIKLARCVTGAEDVIIYTSESVSAKGFSSWAKFKVRANELCKGDKWSPIKIIVCYKSGGNEQVFGEGMFSVDQLLNHHNAITLADKSRQKCVGSLRVTCEVADIVTFSDYVKAGLKFNTMLAVDFSDSLCVNEGLFSNHFAKNDKSFASEYQKVMTDIYPFLSQANNANKLAVYGLGGTKRQEGKGSCFDVRLENLTRTPTNRKAREEITGPWISNLSEMMLAYEDMVINKKLGGECRIAHVIEKAKCLAKFNTLYRSQEYVVLVIVTDGHIDDFDQTLRSLYGAQNLPVSIVFVQVGDGNSEDLMNLERGVETFEQKVGVSFIKFNKRGKKQGNKLSVDIIKEIPKHIREFIDMEREKIGVDSDCVMNTEFDTEDSTPKNTQNSMNNINTAPESRETVLRRTIPPMMKTWLYENNKKEFNKARDLVEKMSVEFKVGKAFV